MGFLKLRVDCTPSSFFFSKLESIKPQNLFSKLQRKNTSRSNLLYNRKKSSVDSNSYRTGRICASTLCFIIKLTLNESKATEEHFCRPGNFQQFSTWSLLGFCSFMFLLYIDVYWVMDLPVKNYKIVIFY